jgi:hypothetical protein
MMALPAFQVECGEEVAGYEFHYDDMNFIKVWKNGRFYTLTEAYEQDILTTEDISVLSEIQNQRKWVYLGPFFLTE